MVNILPYVQIFLAILLISAVLLQHRGTGLGGAFASESNVYRSKRDIEKFLYYATVVLSFLFVTAAILNIIIRT